MAALLFHSQFESGLEIGRIVGNLAWPAAQALFAPNLMDMRLSLLVRLGEFGVHYGAVVNLVSWLRRRSLCLKSCDQIRIVQSYMRKLYSKVILDRNDGGHWGFWVFYISTFIRVGGAVTWTPGL